MEKNIKILLVDDEEDFLETTCKRLIHRGYAVKSETTSAGALQVIGSCWPDVVVLDVMLPDKDGIQCLQEIKQQWPAIKVILLTGHASLQIGMQSLEYGASDYCLKPIEIDELLEKIVIAYQETQDLPA